MFYTQSFQEAVGSQWGLLLCSTGQTALRQCMKWTLGSSAHRSELNEDATKSNANALCFDLFLASLYEQRFIKITCVVTVLQVSHLGFSQHCPDKTVTSAVSSWCAWRPSQIYYNNLGFSPSNFAGGFTF